MDWHDCLLFLVLAYFLKTVSSDEPSTNGSETRLLSRRKRFLIFPDGSSLQLVFCCQTAALIPIGDIFLYGNTAALAWNLPNDPDFITMFKEYERTGQRRQDINEIYYLDEQGKVLAKVPYKRKPIVNPAFAKRSIDEQKTSFREKLKLKLDKTKMHEKQKNRDYLKREHMNEKSIQFHRNSRVGLYEKLEKLFTALGRDGRQCILHKLCEAGRSAAQGTFLQELARVVFTLPKGDEFEYEAHREYDKAHQSEIEDCSAKYPECEDLPINM